MNETEKVAVTVITLVVLAVLAPSIAWWWMTRVDRLADERTGFARKKNDKDVGKRGNTESGGKQNQVQSHRSRSTPTTRGRTRRGRQRYSSTRRNPRKRNWTSLEPSRSKYSNDQQDDSSRDKVTGGRKRSESDQRRGREQKGSETWYEHHRRDLKAPTTESTETNESRSSGPPITVGVPKQVKRNALTNSVRADLDPQPLAVASTLSLSVYSDSASTTRVANYDVRDDLELGMIEIEVQQGRIMPTKYYHSPASPAPPQFASSVSNHDVRDHNKLGMIDSEVQEGQITSTKYYHSPASPAPPQFASRISNHDVRDDQEDGMMDREVQRGQSAPTKYHHSPASPSPAPSRITVDQSTSNPEIQSQPSPMLASNRNPSTLRSNHTPKIRIIDMVGTIIDSETGIEKIIADRMERYERDRKRKIRIHPNTPKTHRGRPIPNTQSCVDVHICPLKTCTLCRYANSSLDTKEKLLKHKQHQQHQQKDITGGVHFIAAQKMESGMVKKMQSSSAIQSRWWEIGESFFDLYQRAQVRAMQKDEHDHPGAKQSPAQSILQYVYKISHGKDDDCSSWRDVSEMSSRTAEHDVHHHHGDHLPEF